MGGRRHAATTQGFHWTGLVQPLETFASFLLLFLVAAQFLFSAENSFLTAQDKILAP